MSIYTYSLLVVFFPNICVDWQEYLLTSLCAVVTFSGLVYPELALCEIELQWFLEDGITISEMEAVLIQYNYASHSNLKASPGFSLLPDTGISPNFRRQGHLSLWMNFRLTDGCSAAQAQGLGFQTAGFVRMANVLRASPSGCLKSGRLHLSDSPAMTEIYQCVSGQYVFLSFCLYCLVPCC